jgi:hypothetical protein
MSHTQPLAIWNNGPRSGLAVDLSAFFRKEPGAEGRVGALGRIIDGSPTLRDIELFRAQLRVIANSDTRSRTNRTQRAADLLGRLKAATADERTTAQPAAPMSEQARAILEADARDGVRLETTTAETIAALFRNGSLDARKPYADANVAAAKLVNLKRLVCTGLESERATARAVDAMRAERDEARAILARIMRAELTDNNGAVMGEATLCRSFLMSGFRALGTSAADLLGPACFERVANMN